MKRGTFLYLALLLGQCVNARIFVKRADQRAVTFDFPVGCSAYNGYHQVAWLGAGEKTDGENAEYAVSCAKHVTIEGSVRGGEALPIITPRAMKKTHLFTNSVRKPVEFNVDNPVHGAACKLMVLHATLPVIVLKNAPNSLYILSDQFVDEKTMEREGITIVSSFSFNKNEVIHHIVSHANSLYVFHAQGDFGVDETSRVTVLGVKVDQLKIDDREQPFAFHQLWTLASRQIQKTDVALMGDSLQPVAAIGSNIKTVEHEGKLFAGFSVTADKSGSACGLIRLSLSKKKKPEENTSEKPLETGQAQSSASGSVTPIIEVAETKKEELVVQEQPVEAALVKSLAVDEKPEEKKELLPETFDIKDENLEYEIELKAVLSEKTTNKTALPFYASKGQTVSVSNLSVMHTSTAMSCLVFATDHDIFTIPFDASGQVVAQGFVEDYFSTGNFISRSYKSDADDRRADQKRSIQSTVTSFSVPQKIKEIQVAGDVVYVKYDNHNGVYSYRALFNDNGSIGGWCESERFARDKKVDFFFIGYQLPFTWYGYHEKNSCVFEQSMWEISTQLTEELFATIEKNLPQNVSGVQGLHSLSCNDLYSVRSGIVATGYEQAVYGSFDCLDDSVAAVHVQAVTIPGAGALVAAATAGNMNEHQEWLLLGGVGGLYAYAAVDGSGFGMVNTIGDALTNNCSWQKIGNLSFVKKIFKNKLTDDFVYVIAKGGLYKVSMNKKMFAEPKIEQIFNAMSLGSKFDYVSDCFIAGDFAIVGTSKGLYAIDDLEDTGSAYKLDLDGSIGAVMHISSCKGSQDFDNLYVLSNDHFKQLGKVHRFVIKNKKCTLFEDCKIEEFQKKNVGIKGSFLDMATACSSFYSNGTWHVKMNYPSYKREHEAIQCYQSGLRSGLDTVRTANRSLLRNMNLKSLDGAKNIVGMMHDKTLGCWIVFGDFGLRILS